VTGGPQIRDASETRRAVRAWLATAWDPERPVREWWALTVREGWQFPRWPDGLGGRGLSVTESHAVYEEFARYGALGPPFGVAQTHGAPVIIEFGTEEQKRRIVPPVALGLQAWCQLFSEPEAGSDLASLRTSASRLDDGWVVRGQKVWTSGAMTADHGILLARTRSTTDRHQGLSFFVIAMRQPGVDVRPIAQMNGADAYFNQTFFDGARVPPDDLIGQEGDGWRLATATLAMERAMNAKVPGLVTAAPGPAGALDQSCGEVMAEGERGVPYFRHRTFLRSDVLARAAADVGRSHDPLVRQRLSQVWMIDRLIQITDARGQARQAAGGQPGVEANLTKLNRSILSGVAQNVASDMLGPAAQLSGPESYEGGAFTDMILTVPSISIAGGTDEIQRNIVGER
jgi:alkylation response protein AidB-like acyl-CoA dehydrogenase